MIHITGVQSKNNAYHNVNKVQSQSIYEWNLLTLWFALFLLCTPEYIMYADQSVQKSIQVVKK
jgi:amino acid permease